MEGVLDPTKGTVVGETAGHEHQVNRNAYLDDHNDHNDYERYSLGRRVIFRTTRRQRENAPIK